MSNENFKPKTFFQEGVGAMPSQIKTEHTMSSDQYEYVIRALDEIKSAIMGNKAIGHDGLVEKVKGHEKRIQAIERYFIIFFAVASFFGTALSLTYPILKDFIHH